MPGWIRTALTVGGMILVMGLGSAATVSRVEENNRFCASCHTPLETLYVDQAARAGPEDSPNLAAYHYAATVQRDDGAASIVNCVACHRGDNGPGHRAVALALGAINTIQWLLGDDGSNAAGKRRFDRLPSAGCSRCHDDALAEQGFENHFHFYLAEYNADPVTRGDVAANALLCNDCHVSHQNIPQKLDFLADEIVFPACTRCHVVWGRGPQDDLN
jgi:hypothetical protein